MVVVREESSERDDDDDTSDFPKAFLLVVFVVVLRPRVETKTVGCAAAAEDDMLGCRSVNSIECGENSARKLKLRKEM